MSLCMTSLVSCNQKQGTSEVTISSDYSENKAENATSSDTDSRKKAMYEKGKNWAKYCKEMSEKTFKERYQRDCEDDEVTNRELYQEFKRGFYDGVKELSGLDDISVAKTSASESRKKAMYEKGKSWAKYCKEMSEKAFKERYQRDCEDDEVTNRTLYEEYKRGFYDGVKALEGL